MLTDNQLKNSKATATENGSGGGTLANGENSLNQRAMYDESYDSKDLELEGQYESDEDMQGIPAGLAMTSHMMNENILLSFFPP